MAAIHSDAKRKKKRYSNFPFQRYKSRQHFGTFNPIDQNKQELCKFISKGLLVYDTTNDRMNLAAS